MTQYWINVLTVKNQNILHLMEYVFHVKKLFKDVIFVYMSLNINLQYVYNANQAWFMMNSQNNVNI